MNAPCVLTVASLSPYYLEGLQAMGVEVLDRLHERDPEAFARQAHRIRAVAAAGDSLVPAALIAQLPALEVISVIGRQHESGIGRYRREGLLESLARCVAQRSHEGCRDLGFRAIHQFVELGTLLFGVTRGDRLFDAAGRMGLQDLRLDLG